MTVQAGDKISSVTQLLKMLGCTEGMLLPAVQTSPEDWDYFHYYPEAGLEFRDSGEGLFESFQVRDAKDALFRTMFHTFPDADEVSLKDLYSKHPTKPGLWRYRGKLLKASRIGLTRNRES